MLIPPAPFPHIRYGLFVCLSILSAYVHMPHLGRACRSLLRKRIRYGSRSDHYPHILRRRTRNERTLKIQAAPRHSLGLLRGQLQEALQDRRSTKSRARKAHLAMNMPHPYQRRRQTLPPSVQVQLVQRQQQRPLLNRSTSGRRKAGTKHGRRSRSRRSSPRLALRYCSSCCSPSCARSRNMS